MKNSAVRVVLKMNKYVAGMIVSAIIGLVGLVLLIYQTVQTKSVGVNVGLIPPVGILYAFVFAAGVIAAIALYNLNTPSKK